jgi:2-polyprenyl-3-methyl-5-hydroxy-6-metoxy-1,4-benzoquinol methylase
MKKNLLRWLVCPSCRGPLRLTVKSEREQEVEEGALDCAGCQKRFPVVRGIPRFCPPQSYADSFGRQWNKFPRLQLDSQNGTSFSRDRFFSITEWDPKALKEKLVLDVGCGAGRFTEVALQSGPEVVAVDLSSAIDACRQNLGHHPSCHFVQASIYELPFPDATFDLVYCIGVIQHTPDPRRSVLDILRKTAIGGQAALWIYELNWKCFVGTLGFKYLLRPWTRRMSVDRLERFCEHMEQVCWPILRWARNAGLAGRIVMRALPVSSAHLHGLGLAEKDFREWVVLDTFDSYSPAHDHPQRFETVCRWLEESGFRPDARHPHGGIAITGSRIN